MPVWRKYLTLLALAAPLAAWAGWQGAAGSRDVFVAAAPPAEGGMPDPKAQAKTRQEAAAAAADAKLLARAALRFEPDAPGGLTDKDAKDTAAVTAARAAEYVNLRNFLAGRAEFVGNPKRKKHWTDLHRGQAEARTVADDIAKFRAQLPGNLAPAEVAEKLESGLMLLKQYRATDGADHADAASWELSIRARLVAAGYAWADTKYRVILARPADAIDGKDWAELRGLLPAIGKSVDEVTQFERNTPHQVRPEAARDAADARRLRADWEAREKLFTLFPATAAALEPDQLAGLFDGVQKAHAALKPTDPGRDLVRHKVQAFCGGFVPGKLWLGADVVLDTYGLCPRSQIEIPTAGGKDQPQLTDDPLGLNEHNFTDRLRGIAHVIGPDKDNPAAKQTYFPSRVKATPASGLAFAYTAARQGVTAWTGEAVKKLRDRCDEIARNKEFGVDPERVRENMDAIPAFTDRADAKRVPARVTARLAALAAVIGRHPALFDPPAR